MSRAGKENPEGLSPEIENWLFEQRSKMIARIVTEQTETGRQGGELDSTRPQED